ncbi:MAG: alkaline phosphatase family protein [Bacteroidales bacterium]|jgi:predicted AlkP superfamily pyrophosphatase or phosphodiesterase|nr:alkaline phosphatase family protein [Bacteroidales bacterium]
MKIAKTLHLLIQLKNIILTVLLSTPAAVLSAQPAHRIPPAQPRLIVGIVVEQMRSDYIGRFWNKFGEGGFKRLASEGTFCRNAGYNHFFMQTAVGYATIYTGALPSGHGIVADRWFDRVAGKMQTAVSDETAGTVEGAFASGQFSPRNLLATTIGDEIRLSNLQQSKVFGVSFNPESAILSAGHAANGAFWFDCENGAWITSNYYMDHLPNWLADENRKKLADLYLARTWEPELPPEQYGDCLPDANPYETGIEGRIVFPYSLPELAKNKSIDKRYRLINRTPFGNSLTKDMAIAVMVNENLGKDDFPDLLTVAFTATENIGNDFGNMSVELEDVFIKLDRELEHFLNFLDEFAGKQNVLVFLTSNHGAAPMPDRLNEAKIPVGKFNANSAVSLLRSYLNAIYGSGEWIKTYYRQQLYLNTELIENSKLKLEDFRQTVAQFMIQFTGVSNTLTAGALQSRQFTEGFAGTVQNSYFPRRSGDVFINLYPGWIEKGTDAASHNSSYIYDTQVPLIWYGWKVKRDNITAPVNITSIAPTIAHFLNITPPNASSGKIITEMTDY